MADENKEDKEFTEWTNGLKSKFYKGLWVVFVTARIPIILMWVAFLIGIILGTIAG